MGKGKPKEMLTNECLAKSFPDNFTLALTSIDYARNRIYSGKEFTLSMLSEVIYNKKLDTPKAIIDNVIAESNRD